MTTDQATSTGGCLCGGVRYLVSGPLRGVIACHCSQCRRTSGHFVAATSASSSAISLTNSETLVWYASSHEAERGFCNRCGGNIFWRRTTGDRTMTSIMAGTLDPPTHVKIERHIFVGDKSDYYEIGDAAPQFAQWA